MTEQRIGPGRAIGSWTLVERLGAGTFGEVWKARHRELEGRLAAFKFPTDAAVVEMLSREGHLLAALDHSSIVRIEDLNTAADPPYLRMEYIDGRSLADRFRAGEAFAVDEAVAIADAILEGLAYAHARGILHRDLAPGNVLLSGSRVKLVDFGLAAVEQGWTRSLLVRSGGGGEAAPPSFAGTLPYMAPEQRAGEPVDARADLYSVGVLLYQMLTGRLPTGLRPASHFRPELDPGLDAAIVRLLDAADTRPSSAVAARELIRTAGFSRHDAPGDGVPAKAGGPSPTLCPFCRNRLSGRASVSCMSCGRQWDRTFEEWKSAYQARRSLAWGLLALSGAAAVAFAVLPLGGAAGDFSLPRFLAAMLLNPVSWAGCAMFHLVDRAGEAVERSARREGRRLRHSSAPRRPASWT